MVVKRISFLSLFLCLMLGIPTYMFGALPWFGSDEPQVLVISEGEKVRAEKEWLNQTNVATHSFGDGGRQRSESSLEVADFDNYWLKKPERWEDLEQLTKKFNAEKLRRVEEEQKRVAAKRAENKQKKKLKDHQEWLNFKIKYEAERPQREREKREKEELF